MHGRAVAIVVVGIGSLVMTGAAAPGSSESSVAGSSSPGSSERGPELELSPSSTDFKTVGLSEHADRTVNILNHGDETVELGDVDVVGTWFEPLFDNCSGKRIERDDSCALTIRFAPRVVGTFEGQVVLHMPIELRGTLTGTGVSSVVTGPPSSPPTQTTDTTEVPQSTVPATPPTTTPSTEPATTVPGEDNRLVEKLRSCEADAETAEVRYSPKLQMTVGTSTDVRVVASIHAGGTGPPGTGPPTTVVPAVLHCEVEATLRGQGFDVDPDDLHPQRGSFLDRPTIEWSWSVTPTSPGQRTLHFQLLPVAQEGELRLLGSPIPFDATIAVVAAPRSFWDRVDDVVRGVVGYPLVTSFGALAGIVTVLAAGWRWVLKRPWPWSKQTPARRARPRKRGARR